MIKYALAMAALAAATTFAAAETQNGDWHVFHQDAKCWAASSPVRSEGSIPGRSGPFLSIQNDTSEGVRGSVAIVSGFEASGDGEVKVSVDGEPFEVLPFADAAFPGSGKPEAVMVAAMRKGRELSVTWTSSSGETATDVYSLDGFTASLAQANDDCR